MTEESKIPIDIWIHSYDCVDFVRDDVAWTQEQHQEKLGLSDMSIHVVERRFYTDLKERNEHLEEMLDWCQTSPLAAEFKSLKLENAHLQMKLEKTESSLETMEMKYNEALKDLTEMNDNCISRSLHEHRMDSCQKHLQIHIDDEKEILKYCQPHMEQMWASVIVGIILECDFRDAGTRLKEQMNDGN